MMSGTKRQSVADVRTVTDSSPLKAKEPLPGITPKLLRASHRKVLQLFRLYGSQTDQELYEAAKAEGWQISPSGLRSRRSELSPPRGAGIRDTGRKRKTQIGVRGAVIWELDESVEPWAGRS